MTNEDDKVKAYMAAHPELVAKIAEKHGVEVVEETHEEDIYWLMDSLYGKGSLLMPMSEPEQGVLYIDNEVSEVLPEDYLEQNVEEDESSKPRRFGEGSTAEGPDEIVG